ncbi:MAG: hypothetical protein H7647_06860 [Candidatus Heimdallarchaeota archaeon]|nr:hypothetical protein [Candidatus Heimdallarchaeota archaeon]MCK4254147.1 hypothetical protein [Candidatus Heimdallarchaeota archaeon]
MSDKETTVDFFLGLGAGYLVASFLAKDAEPVYFGDIRLHHYLVGLLAVFNINNFTRGLCTRSSSR